MTKDLIGLLKAIPSIMECSYVTRAKMIKKVVNIQMRNGESIGEYARQFRQYCDALEDKVGTLCFGGSKVLSTVEYQRAGPTDQTK
jgi:hypothetical protein